MPRRAEADGMGWAGGIGPALAKELGIKATPVETTWGFRVSRSPVRAALKQLEEAGVLTSGERSGYRLVDAQAAQTAPRAVAGIWTDGR
ncbi:hypothetical protein DPM13_15625 [Paracoccus mutanolyticus]|uniref:HTH gntR-type domain-containing protein n=1 Tax=Paracoccus mutanolyticus TaxID=1499308 RepID=A0ABN5M7B2_9RHOB|nr:GntR family transcriptional regulator [Paracoccus mutanolyticus]AWX93927.1 hypothetical protein DPM13_15625 [Paracoccus mutanolyticus]